MPFSIALLAGGNASRYGADKTLETLDGIAFIRRIINEVSPLSSDIMLVSKNPRKFGGDYPDVRMVQDVFDEQCPMVGIISALEAARHDVVCFVSADAPLVSRHVPAAMATALEDGFDVAVPAIDGKLYPLLGAYRRSVAEFFRVLHGRGHFKIVRAFEEMSVVVVKEDILDGIDPDRASFININEPKDLESAKARLARRASS